MLAMTGPGDGHSWTQAEVNADSSVTDGLLQEPLCPFPYFYMKHPQIRYLFFNQENHLGL